MVNTNVVSSLISVIIPCYNAEKTIKRTLQSLNKQTHDFFEVIIINDGSTDNTDMVINDYMKDSKLNIKYIIKKNGGVSSARNRGLDIAKGEYIVFLDADDVYHCGFIKTMYNTLKQYKIDTVYCLHTRNVELLMDLPNNLSYKNVITLTQTQLMNDFMYKKGKIGFWAFIYKSKILNKHNIKFTLGAKYGEDLEFTWKYLVHCSSGAVINEKMYGYYDNPTSAVNAVNWRKTDLLGSISRIEDYLIENRCKYYEEFSNYMYSRAIMAVLKTFAWGKRNDLFNRLLKEYDVKPSMKILIKKDPKLLVRLSAAVYCIHPKLFYWAITLY